MFTISFSTSACLIEEKFTYTEHNIKIDGKKGTKVANQEACARLSFSTKGAKFWSYLPAGKLCYVKSSKSGRRSHPTVVSGNRECGNAGNLPTFKCASYTKFHIIGYLVPCKLQIRKLAGWPGWDCHSNIVGEGLSNFFGL